MVARNVIHYEMIQIDPEANGTRYTQPRDWQMESIKPRVNQAEKDCCTDAQIEQGVTMRQPL